MVLAGGQTVGVWEHEVQRGSLVVKIHFFTTEASSPENDVILEVNRLGEIFGSHVKLTLSLRKADFAFLSCLR